MTRVVNVKYSSYDVYIGRYNSYYNLSASKFANPFEIGRHGGREKVLELYNEYLNEHPELIEAAVRELDGKVLGCWCSPNPRCHGNILIERINKWKEEHNETYGSLSSN
jgi:hypothetical protein